MKKFIQKIKIMISSFVLLVAGFALTSCIVPQPKENFELFSNSIFQTLVGNDELTSNYLFNHPENFGLERYEPSLPTPGKTDALGLLLINLYFGQIKGFDYTELNEDQQITYDIIVDLLDYINAQTPEMSYLSNDYLGSYLGYQAQLPLLLIEYHLKDKLDVENYFKYLDLVPTTFETYVNFEVEKANAGYGMPDFVIDKVVAQCENFISKVSDGEEHFMIKVMNDKIDGLDFLTYEEKESYKQKNIEKVNGPLLEGYAYVRDHLPELKGRATNTMGLAHYVKEDGTTIGKNYYEVAFKKAVGYDISVAEAIQYIDGKLAKYEAMKGHFGDIIAQNPNFIEQVSNVQLMSGTPETQITLYQTLIQGHFPTLNLNNPLRVQIKYIDKAMEDNFSPAAYMNSPIDELTNEFIYLNNKSIMIQKENETGEIVMDYDYNYLYTTLAHEGFPGHLYQNVYFKNQNVNLLRKVLKNTGYMEGWATYAEHYMYKLLEGYNQDVIDYLVFQDEYQGAIYSRLDMGIHYNGWTIEQTHQFLSRYFNITEAQTTEIYQRLVEVPTNSQLYYFTYFKLVDLYEDVSTALGEHFDPVVFHKMILDCGPIPLKYVEARVRKAYGL